MNTMSTTEALWLGVLDVIYMPWWGWATLISCALLGAGFTIFWNDRTSSYVYYDGELGRRNYESTSVTGGLRIAF